MRATSWPTVLATATARMAKARSRVAADAARFDEHGGQAGADPGLLGEVDDGQHRRLVGGDPVAVDGDDQVVQGGEGVTAEREDRGGAERVNGHVDHGKEQA